MVYRGKTKVVDAFTTLRATQRHGLEKKFSAPSNAENAPEPDKKTSAARKTGARPQAASGIGRTVMPTQNEIVCYSCGFSFIMRGRAETTQCPKCGARLSLKDQTVTGACSEELITAGIVRLTKSAILDGGKIVANDVIIEGMIKSGSIQAHKTLELAAGATIPEEFVVARNLRIGAEASFDFLGNMEFHDVEIFGELKANLKVTGVVTIHAGGHLLGSLQTDHLIVEEGGGLTADVRVEPPPEETEEEEETELRKTA